MTNITFNGYTLEKCSTLIVDAPLVLMEYIHLWERQIAFLAQDLAGKHSAVQGQFFRNRALLIKILGFNPGSGAVDFHGPFFTMPEDHIITLLSSVLYANELSLKDSKASIWESIEDFWSIPDNSNLVSISPENLQKLKDLKAQGVRVICLCTNPFTDDAALIGKTEAAPYIDDYIDCNHVYNDLLPQKFTESIVQHKDETVIITPADRGSYHPLLRDYNVVSYTFSNVATDVKSINSFDLISLNT